ncbi:hypothetical protein HYX09_03465 [Candidatus Woesearchaeota archaeon]|nr:hypothetical protein [Candidatus Woesearchaeota archaeon]
MESKNPNHSKLQGIFTPENGHKKPEQSSGVSNPFSLKELDGRLRASRHEVSGLKNSLNRLLDDKENTFRQKQALSTKIGLLISKIKELKARRDSLTRQVKEKKEQRNRHNESLKAVSAALDSLFSEKERIMKTGSIRHSPSAIEKLIEELDYKVQTEGYTFEREKKVMKQINDLKMQLGNSKDLAIILEGISGKRSLMSSHRKEANRLHSEIRQESAESQKLHEEMLKVSKEVDGLRPQWEVLAKRLEELRDGIKKQNLQFREKLKELGHARAEMDRLEITKIKDKEDEIEKKIRSGKKLTTEDLLAFQEQFRKR